MTDTPPIPLTSETKTGLAALRNTKIADRKSGHDKYWRLTKLQRPDILDQTVTRYEEPTKVAVLGVVEPKVRANATTGVDPDEEARRLDDIEHIKRGEPIVERMDTQSQINHEARKLDALEVVIEDLEKQIRDEERKLAIAYLLKIKPKTDAQMQRFVKAVADLHTAHREISDMYRDLRDSGIGFPANGPTPDFLRSADDFFHEAAHHGFVK
jgi:hypothetical protein